MSHFNKSSKISLFSQKTIDKFDFITYNVFRSYVTELFGGGCIVIATKRQEKGLTQKELADKLNVDRSTVTKWELGLSFPKTKLLIELSKIFGCTVDELLKEEV